jgi:seryl-tRNA synthetase
MEVSSISNCGDFQSRRMNTRYKVNEKRQYPHTLNGSALAIGRIIIAILENFQNKDGTVNIPQVLKKYMNNIERL